MAASFKEKHQRPFPLESFAERIYERHASGSAELNIEGFELEAAELAEHRLMVHRTGAYRISQLFSPIPQPVCHEFFGIAPFGQRHTRC